MSITTWASILMNYKVNLKRIKTDNSLKGNRMKHSIVILACVALCSCTHTPFVGQSIRNAQARARANGWQEITMGGEARYVDPSSVALAPLINARRLAMDPNSKLDSVVDYEIYKAQAFAQGVTAEDYARTTGAFRLAQFGDGLLISGVVGGVGYAISRIDSGGSGSGNDEGTKTEISGDGNTVIIQRSDRGSQNNGSRDSAPAVVE